MGLLEQRREAFLAKGEEVKAAALRHQETGSNDDYEFVKAGRDELLKMGEQIEQMAESKGALSGLDDIMARLRGADVQVIHPGDNSEPARKAAATSRKSPGLQVVSDPRWGDWLKSVSQDGHIPDNVGVKSPSFPVRPVKSLITGASDTSGGAGVYNDVQNFGFVDLATRRKLTLRDVVSSATTNSDTVEYVTITTATNSAAVTAEATSASDGAKPEGTRAFAKVTTPVRTIAEWMAITRRALADNGQMRGYIDNTLMEDLELALETEMVTGDGTGEHLTGLEHTANVQTQAFSTDILTTARKAKTNVEVTGHDTPTAYLMNPADWETFDLGQNANLDFYFGGPRQILNPTLWGLPVITSEAVTQGTPWVGNFKVCYLWDREQAQVLVADQHSDLFIRNILIILAEMRAAFGVIKPKSLCSFAMS